MKYSALPALLAALAAVCAGCVSDQPTNGPYNDRPLAAGDGWGIATPAEAGIDTAAITEVYGRLFGGTEFPNALSLIVVRNGKLVAEGYTRAQDDRTKARPMQSATKSIAAMVFGVLYKEGTFGNLDEPISNVFPAEAFAGDARARDITPRHLLTMGSGIDLDNTTFRTDLVLAPAKAQDRYLLARPMFAAPGAAFTYRDADPHLLSYMIQARTGRTVEEIARERIFTPLGITNYTWGKNADSVTMCPRGLSMTPRDMAKIGQLMLAKGEWNGVRILPEDWVTTATTEQAVVGGDPVLSHYSYGFGWWFIPELRAYTAWGHAGQFILVVPEKQLVMVMTSVSETDDIAVGSQLVSFMPLVRRIVRGSN